MEIKPKESEKEEYQKKVEEITTKIKQNVAPAQVILGGSGAKDTWLAGDHDIDLFIAYPLKEYKDKSAQLSSYLEEALQKSFPNITLKRVKGSRDYFNFSYKGSQIEVVPILNIKSAAQALNITDVSPLHTLWVNQNAKKIKDEIRKAKLFCKAQKVYGAESYISGFSGYVLEILIIHYGSFENLLKEAVKWKEKKVIDQANYYPKGDASFHINTSKLVSPLIVIDPVDKSRNAAAALSKEKFLLFKKKAKEYIKNPSEKFFVKEKFTLQEWQKKKKKNILIFIKIIPLEGKKDVIGAKTKKAFEWTKKRLQIFSLVQADWEYTEEEIAWAFVVKIKKLPEYYEQKGPLVEMTTASKEFKKKHKDIFTKEKRLYTKIKHKHRDLNNYIKIVLNEEYIQQKIKEIKTITLL